MNQIDQRSGKAGFTLIEIIAVLVILAVLAAVAIPRYIDLMANARQQALQGAIASGQSQCSLAYGSLILASGGTVPTTAAIAAAATAALANSDFTYTLTANAADITIHAVDASGVASNPDGTWALP